MVIAMAIVSVVLLSLALRAPTALAGEPGYRLLKLDGHVVKWGDRRLGVGARVSYAFAHESMRFDGAINCGEMAPVEVLLDEGFSMDTLSQQAAAAFQVWEGAADLAFYEVSDARNADIVIGAQGLPRGRAFANVSYLDDPLEGVRSIEQSLVCLNPRHGWKVGFDGDTEVYDIRYTLIHEIGHAIGLDHPGPTGQVMAFKYTESFQDLQAGDLRGVQRLYGPANGFVTGLANSATEVDRVDGEEVSTARGLGIGECQPQQAVRECESPGCGCGTAIHQ